MRGQLAKKQAEKAAATKAQQAAEARKQQQVEAAQSRQLMGYGGLGAGAVLVGVGGWLLASWSSDQAALDEKLADRNANGDVVGISLEAYGPEQDRIDKLGIGGASAIGVGVIAAALGTWWLLSPEPGQKESKAARWTPTFDGNSIGFRATF